MIRQSLKEAKRMIKGNRLEAIGVFLLFMFVTCTTTVTTNIFGEGFSATCVTAPFLYTLIILPFACGLYYYFLNMRDGKQKLEDLIEFYIDYKTGLKLIVAMIWYVLIVLVGFVLFIVPGIIWSYRYLLVFYLLIENRNMSIKEAFEKSKELMHGHKFKFFIAELVLMILPMILYCVGAIGLSASLYAYDATSDINVTMNIELDEDEAANEEAVLTNEDATIEELSEVTDINNEVAPSINIVPIIIFGLIFAIGVVLLVYYSPQVLCVEVAYYDALAHKE